MYCIHFLLLKNWSTAKGKVSNPILDQYRQFLCNNLTFIGFWDIIFSVETLLSVFINVIEATLNKISKTPTYNLKVVIRETGLKPDTLRAWERRYGLPNPQRTEGGHRLYSQYDIEMIKWLIDRQKEGMRINRAVKLWRSYVEQDQDPLQVMPVIEESVRPVPTPVISGNILEEIRENWVVACLAFDESRAKNILNQAFARYPLETVCLEVLRKGLSEIGDLWYTGESTVQQEHFASALAIRRLNALLVAAPPPTSKGKVLAACPPGEDHIFPLLLITLLLRMRGWEVIYLGANVPLNKLDIAIRSAKPDLVIATAQQLFTAASLLDVARSLQEAGESLAYGGIIFNFLPKLRDVIPGYFLGESLEGIVQSVERLIVEPPKKREVELVSDEYNQAEAHFKEYQPAIAAYIWEQFQRNGMKDYHLEIANEFLGLDIQAGLHLGDMNFLEHEVDWLGGLLQNHDIPQELLPKYLALYKKAVEMNLDERGKLIVDWLDSVIIEN
jgi:DNA-binding transcriptional MerR regulator